MANKSQGSHWFERLLQLAFYLPSRDDGPTNQALYTDVSGDLQLGFIEIDLGAIFDPAIDGGAIVIGDGAGGLTTSNSVILGSTTSNCVISTENELGQDWCNQQFGTAGSAFYIAKKSNGTIAAPLPILDGQKVGGYAWIANDGEPIPAGPAGSPGYVGAEFSAYATEDQNGTDGGMEVRLSTTPNGTKTQQTVFIARQDGTIDLPQYSAGNLSVDATGKLVVGGSIPSGDMSAVVRRKIGAQGLTVGSTTEIDFTDTDIENNAAVVSVPVNSAKITAQEDGLYYYIFESEFQINGGSTTIEMELDVAIGGTAQGGKSFRRVRFFADGSVPSVQHGRDFHGVLLELSAGDEVSTLATPISLFGGGTVETNGQPTHTLIRMAGPKGDAGPAGTGSTINVQEDGGTVVTGVTTLNVTNGLTITDQGGGVVDIGGPFKASGKLTAPAGNNGTTLLQAFRFTVNVPSDGDYRLDWRTITSNNDAANDFIMEIEVDDVQLTLYQVEHKDPGGAGIVVTNLQGGTFNSGTSQRVPYTDFDVVTLTAGTHNFDINIAGSIAGIESTIYEATMALEAWN